MKDKNKLQARRVTLGQTTLYLGAMPGESMSDCLKRSGMTETQIPDAMQRTTRPISKQTKTGD
jgi:hypothetical protein